MCNFFYSLVSATVHVIEVLLKLLTVILPFYPTLITPDESKEGRNRQDVSWGTTRPRHRTPSMADVLVQLFPHLESDTLGWGEWIVQPEERESLRDLKTFLLWGPWDALGNPVDWSRSEVLNRCHLLSPFSTQCLLFEGRSQKNGSPASGGSMEAIARTEL